MNIRLPIKVTRKNTTSRLNRVPRASTAVRQAMSRLRVPKVRKGKALRGR